jgi:hypothetical protein
MGQDLKTTFSKSYRGFGMVIVNFRVTEPIPDSRNVIDNKLVALSKLDDRYTYKKVLEGIAPSALTACISISVTSRHGVSPSWQSLRHRIS